jgi:ABC-type transport system involved in multi-copper enzyme maturation permease subunit
MKFWIFIFLFFIFALITGIILAMFYNANADIVFNVVFNLTSEIYYG